MLEPSTARYGRDRVYAALANSLRGAHRAQARELMYHFGDELDAYPAIAALAGLTRVGLMTCGSGRSFSDRVRQMLSLLGFERSSGGTYDALLRSFGGQQDFFKIHWPCAPIEVDPTLHCFFRRRLLVRSALGALEQLGADAQALARVGAAAQVLGKSTVYSVAAVFRRNVAPELHVCFSQRVERDRLTLASGKFLRLADLFEFTPTGCARALACHLGMFEADAASHLVAMDVSRPTARSSLSFTYPAVAVARAARWAELAEKPDIVSEIEQMVRRTGAHDLSMVVTLDQYPRVEEYVMVGSTAS